MRILILILAMWAAGWADTHTAASAEQDDVQAAIDASADGDIVLMPEDTVNFTSRAGSSAEQKAPIYINNKNITLLGSGTDKTRINCKLTLSGYNNSGILVNAATKPVRISGFAVVDTNTSRDGFIKLEKLTNTTTATSGFRIDHIRFEWRGDGFLMSDAIIINGLHYGCIDACTLKTYNASGSGTFAQVLYPQDESGVKPNYLGTKAWNLPSSVGSSNRVFIENCVFDLTTQGYDANIIDCGTGGSYTVRYCTIINSLIECHGACSSGNRGTKDWEIYCDSFYFPAYQPNVIKQRSGSGVIYNNRIKGDAAIEDVFILDNQRSDSATGPDCSGTLNSWCNGLADVDGNDSLHGYPCLDQVGLDSGDIGNQRLAPIYVWGNKLNGDAYDTVSLNPALKESTQEEHIRKNRDYFQSVVRPGYYAYTYPHPLTGASSSISVSSIVPSVNMSARRDSINGSGFQSAQGNGYIKVGTTTATIISWADTQIKFTTPTKADMTYKVYVVNNDMQVDSSKTIEYKSNVVNITIKRP